MALHLASAGSGLQPVLGTLALASGAEPLAPLVDRVAGFLVPPAVRDEAAASHVGVVAQGVLVDLDLLAQSYVLGEMDAEESARFEERLSEEQPAREAVERAVALMEALVEPTPVAASGPTFETTTV